jgi:hypothetical protein
VIAGHLKCSDYRGRSAEGWRSPAFPCSGDPTHSHEIATALLHAADLEDVFFASEPLPTIA